MVWREHTVVVVDGCGNFRVKKVGPALGLQYFTDWGLGQSGTYQWGRLGLLATLRECEKCPHATALQSLAQSPIASQRKWIFYMLAGTMRRCPWWDFGGGGGGGGSPTGTGPTRPPRQHWRPPLKCDVYRRNEESTPCERICFDRRKISEHYGWSWFFYFVFGWWRCLL